jgi:phage gp46-like protein
MARGGKREGAGRKPGSLNKATADIREAAQEYTDEALQVLAEVMRSAEHPAAARVSAASAILDRGHGKPKQPVDVDANVRATVRKIELVAVRPSGD